MGKTDQTRTSSVKPVDEPCEARPQGEGVSPSCEANCPRCGNSNAITMRVDNNITIDGKIVHTTYHYCPQCGLCYYVLPQGAFYLAEAPKGVRADFSRYIFSDKQIPAEIREVLKHFYEV